jgi:Mn-dependent DtxR family transcriptional regulator
MEPAVLSHTLEDYMEAIYLIVRQKKVARVKEIAEFLNVFRTWSLLNTRNMAI